MERAVIYVGGFNFYYGVTNHWRIKKGLAGLGWCNFRTLVDRHFPLGGAALEIKYFTAPVRIEHETPHHRKDEQQRYGIWERAVRTIEGLRVVEGFQKGKNRPGNRTETGGEILNSDGPARERQSDMNLAIEVMLDALGPNPPRQVYLLSDDRDLMPVAFALLERVTSPIEVVVLLPSRADARNWQDSYRQSAAQLNDLRLTHRGDPRAPTVVALSEEMLASGLLGYTLADADGSFGCPNDWRLTPAYIERYCPVPEWRPE